MEFKLRIGLEIHIELKTEHKLFCNCKNMFGQEINSLCCPVCLGKENAIPHFNNEVILPVLKAAKVLNCYINTESSFDRKHYTYPDLPKGYQITQRFKPIAENGYLITNGIKVRIAEMHIEEDAGKIIYDKNGDFTVDHNRCGVPLIEIVTEPDIKSAKEAVDFLKNLRLKLLYAGVSDCKMQEGSMRCDVNVSVKPEGSNEISERTEIKNASSFKFIEKTIPLTLSPRDASNLIISELFRDDGVYISEFQLSELSDLLYEGKISSQTAKKVIGIVKKTDSSPKAVAKALNLYQINDKDKIREFVLIAIKNNPETCEDFRKGKKSSIGPILGEISRMGKGLVNLKIATDILEKELI